MTKEEVMLRCIEAAARVFQGTGVADDRVRSMAHAFYVKIQDVYRLPEE